MPEMDTNRPKALFGLPADELEKAGYRPSRQIVPAWFCCHAGLSAVPEHFPLEIAGRSQYKLFVNSQEVVFGPCRSPRDILFSDTVEIAPYLKTGDNQLLVQVLSYPEDPPLWDRRQFGPNFLYGDNEGPAIWLSGTLGDKVLSDPSSWKVWLDKGMDFHDTIEVLTGSSETVNGAESRNNPFLWKPQNEQITYIPQIVQPSDFSSYGERLGRTILPRPVKLLYRREKSFSGWQKQTFPAHTDFSFVLDAGELTTAFFRIRLQNGKGSYVRLTYAESYYQTDEQGRNYKGVRDDTSGHIEGVYDEYTVGGLPSAVYEPFRMRTFRFVRISGKTADEPLTIVPQTYIETAYPLDNSKRPVLKDARKEKLYDTAWRTLQLCAHDSYEDCPYYEQLTYACDTRLEILFTYAATEETELPRHAIRLFASSYGISGLTESRFPSRLAQTIPGFSLHFLLMLSDYYRYTGDFGFVRPFLPLAELILNKFLSRRTPEGLLAPQGYWDYFDWTKEWDPARGVPTAARDGASALENLFFVYTLEHLTALFMADAKADTAEQYTAECTKILQLVEKTCFDEARGLYREGPHTEEYSQHTQIFAVLSGLCKGQKARQIMQKVLDDQSLVQCSFVQKFYLFRALEKTGLYEKTQQLWKPWQDFLDLHCTTFPETPYSPRSDCHGWSALPLYEFSDLRKKFAESVDTDRKSAYDA